MDPGKYLPDIDDSENDLFVIDEEDIIVINEDEIQDRLKDPSSAVARQTRTIKRKRSKRKSRASNRAEARLAKII